MPEEDLPVLLPAVDDFHPSGTGQSPLASVESFVNTTCPTCGGPAERETDVSDNFLDSSWYYLRYPCTDYDDRPFDRQRIERWLPVDMYFGGKEHVVLHHLYSRFVTKALYDLGLVPFDEPFKRLRLHGFLTKTAPRSARAGETSSTPTSTSTASAPTPSGPTSSSWGRTTRTTTSRTPTWSA